ncbi:hypothetical protein IOD13_15860 [Brevibacterium casei]|nr:hypothetical protein [Brevibacterium casei]
MLAAWLADGRASATPSTGRGPTTRGSRRRDATVANYAAGGYNPRNAGDSGGADGRMTVLEATKKSVNKAYADMASH